MIPLARPVIGDAEKAAVLEVLESGQLAQGPRTARLEERFARIVGTRHAVATSSGTTALHLALLAHGIGPGDEVITSPFTFIASANSIVYSGARPVFADVREDTFNLDPGAVERAITPCTRAILPVHLYGHPCDLDAFVDIARRHRLALIEDCAQAIGATYCGKSVGSFGTGVFSLYATKNVMAGEGGMITTDDDGLADRARLLRSHGMRQRYVHEILGYNFRLSDIHAAIGLAQLERLPEFLERRRAHAAYLSGGITSVRTPRVQPGCEHAWHQYTVRVGPRRDRDEVVRQLAAAGVGTGVFYPLPAHRQPYMRGLVGDVHLPVAEQLAREVVSLPVHPALSPAELEVIVSAVNGL
jgi:dTDP-4-amino-4,6-dideoxygalactose transaminase